MTYITYAYLNKEEVVHGLKEKNLLGIIDRN